MIIKCIEVTFSYHSLLYRIFQVDINDAPVMVSSRLRNSQENDMRKNFPVTVCVVVALILSVFSGKSHPEPVTTISFSGLVRQPLNLTLDDLNGFHIQKVRINEITSGREYRGAVVYQGVSLRQILDICTVAKEGSGYSKRIDLAVIIKNREGKRAVLSWGEVGYRNSGDVIIALRGEPVMPMKKCSDCHKSESEYKRWHDPLTRPIGYPKLIIAGDVYSDRCIENITSVEIVNVGKVDFDRKKGTAFSGDVSIIGNGKNTVKISDIGGTNRIDIAAKQTGDGKGFHGMHNYNGVPLAALLEKNGVHVDVNSLMVFSSPDGYRSIISGGELLLSAAGKNIIIADTREGKPIREMGKFHLVIPDDLSADRWVKSLGSIEILTIEKNASLSIIGVGCGDTDLLTLEAVSAMAAADVFICTDDIKNRFAKYIGDKPVLYDPLLTLPHYYQKMNPGVSPDEIKKRIEKLRGDNIAAIKDALKAGKNVAFLEYGDPTIYGSWTYWLYQHFRSDEVRVVPGVSAFNAANAMIGKNISASGSVIITVPDGIRSNEAMVQAAAKKGDILAVFVGLNEFKSLIPVLSKYFRNDTPVFVVFKAGYSDEGRLLKFTLSDAADAIGKDREKFLGLIYIGDGLK